MRRQKRGYSIENITRRWASQSEENGPRWGRKTEVSPWYCGSQPMNPADPYRVVFDSAQNSFDWSFGAYALIFVGVGIFMIWFGRRNGWTAQKRRTGYFIVGISLLLSAIGLLTSWSTYSRGRSAMREQAIAEVDGPVTDFRPMSYGGHGDECFTVQTRTFCYSDFDITPGFHNAASHGGPIREGLPVRVFYSGNMIVRLEVRADALPTDAERSAMARAAQRDWQQRMSRNATIDRMNFGFLIATVFVAAWWNLQPVRFMGFWMKPPYKSSTVAWFRLFFAACLVGGAVSLAQEILGRPRALSDYRGAIIDAAGWIVVWWVMVRVMERFGARGRGNSPAA